eukprot:Pgem_evm1s2741
MELGARNNMESSEQYNNENINLPTDVIWVQAQLANNEEALRQKKQEFLQQR